MNAFVAPGQYHRIVSVEMFEHMRNWEALLANVATWLKSEGMLFIHIFTHRRFAYPFEVRGSGDWMAQHFFTGGMMPSDDLLGHFDRDLCIMRHWQISGTHYRKTSEDWLRNMDRAKAGLWPILADTYGSENVKRWWMRWRIFFLACAELWGYRGGKEWMVSHYLLRKTGSTRAPEALPLCSASL
jgi:cyclopropane-fatty-acyl-phospholipid synthase